MKKICAWCKKDLGEIPVDSIPEDSITHGICYDCSHHLFAEIGMPLRSFLDGLDAPVLVVDSNCTVTTANDIALKLVNKDLTNIEGFRGGEVFGCAYARLPGGCGNTVHCSGCTIRRTVMDTFRTGKSHSKVPAILKQQKTTEPQEIHLHISTEKVADVVLLRVDKVQESSRSSE